MTGTHQCMFSLNPSLQLNTSTTAVFMSSSAEQNTVKEKVMAIWSNDEEEEEWLDEMSEEELLSVKEKVKPIRLVLTKVSRFNKYKHESTNQQRSRTHGSTVSWCLQGYQKFLHNRSSQVVRRPRNTGSQATHHASRCVHTMELDIRCASIRHRLPCST